MMRRILAFAALAAVPFFGCSRLPNVPAPQPAEATPANDIWLYRFGQFGRGSGVFNITNRIGYDNQPFWEKNDRILYTALSGGQYDIRVIDFGDETNTAVTNTIESEYSAALTPDGKALTVVRVERDSTQRLWRFPRDGSAPSVLLPNIKPVGYFAWLDSTSLALFVLGSPNTLQIADTRTGTGRVVTTGIGRSIQRIPGGRRASYVRRVGPRFVLESVDPAADGFDVDTIATLPDSAEFVVWRSATEAYTAAGSRIFRLRLPSKSWTVVEDLSSRGVRGITRLALSPDGSRLALVAEDPKPER
jgi:dipeptidyl aminopeptidase/acylaminoacyl peptidase